MNARYLLSRRCSETKIFHFLLHVKLVIFNTHTQTHIQTHTHIYIVMSLDNVINIKTFDLKFIFININQLNIYNVINILFINHNKIFENVSNNYFKRLRNVFLKNNYITFNNKLYLQLLDLRKWELYSILLDNEYLY